MSTWVRFCACFAFGYCVGDFLTKLVIGALDARK